MNYKTILSIGRCFFLGIMCCLIFSSGAVAVTLPDGMVVSYTHDALTRPVAKAIDGVVVEKYLWNGRTQLLAVLEPDNSVRQRFIYADDRLPYAMTQGGATYYLAYDQVGSLRVVSDASGNIVKQVTYDTFGNIIDDTNASFAVPFGFAGGLHDQETGLVRFGYRDYSPEIGRWTAKDPIGFAGGDTNLYGYVFSDPVNFVDPEGKEAILPYAVAIAPVIAMADSPFLPFADILAGALILGAWMWDNMPSESDYVRNVCESRGRSPHPIGGRYQNNSKKKAKERARKAGGGKEPIHHPDGEHGPHYHPNLTKDQIKKGTPKAPSPHDHYYYPKGK